MSEIGRPDQYGLEHIQHGATRDELWTPEIVGGLYEEFQYADPETELERREQIFLEFLSIARPSIQGVCYKYGDEIGQEAYLATVETMYDLFVEDAVATQENIPGYTLRVASSRAYDVIRIRARGRAQDQLRRVADEYGLPDEINDRQPSFTERLDEERGLPPLDLVKTVLHKVLDEYEAKLLIDAYAYRVDRGDMAHERGIRRSTLNVQVYRARNELRGILPELVEMIGVEHMYPHLVAVDDGSKEEAS